MERTTRGMTMECTATCYNNTYHFNEWQKGYMKTTNVTELEKVASISIEKDTKKVKIIVSDIEGCLNLNEHTYDFDALHWIRTANQLARENNPIPFITVCSGRQHAFVEAITQLIAGTLPAIFENGCGLYFPTRRLYEEYLWHPLLNESGVLSQFKEVCQRVTEEVIVPNYARRVPGKEVMLSLHPVPPQEVRDIFRMVVEIIAKNQLVVSVTRSASAVDITPQGIDKAAGVQWLIDTLKESFSVKLADIAGIGDSAGDIAFLRIVGFSAAPVNASESVKDIVNYSSSSADGQGVVDIIRQCINANIHA